MKLIDNNGYTVARGSMARLMAFVERQRQFDSSYALWLVKSDGHSSRVL